MKLGFMVFFWKTTEDTEDTEGAKDENNNSL